MSKKKAPATPTWKLVRAHLEEVLGGGEWNDPVVVGWLQRYIGLGAQDRDARVIAAEIIADGIDPIQQAYYEEGL